MPLLVPMMQPANPHHTYRVLLMHVRCVGLRRHGAINKTHARFVKSARSIVFTHHTETASLFPGIRGMRDFALEHDGKRHQAQRHRSSRTATIPSYEAIKWTTGLGMMLRALNQAPNPRSTQRDGDLRKLTMDSKLIVSQYPVNSRRLLVNTLHQTLKAGSDQS